MEGRSPLANDLWSSAEFIVVRTLFNFKLSDDQVETMPQYGIDSGQSLSNRARQCLQWSRQY